MVNETSLVLLPLLAVLAPLFARFISPVLRVPIVVFELVLGILVGPSVLGWITPGDFLDTLSEFGLALLFFMAGSEIDFRAIKGHPGVRAGLGWLVSLLLGVAVGLLIAPGEAAIVVGIALCSTALGTLMPILRDAGELPTPFGRAAIAIGALGEFGPLIAISVFLGSRQPGVSTVVLFVFVAITLGVIIVANRMKHGHLHRFVRSTLHTSGQFAIRVVMGILGALVALSVLLDLDMLLGAFAAGVIWQILMREAPAEDKEQVDSKLEAVAFGFLVPIFFIYTGVTFDLASLTGDWHVALLVPVFVVVLLLTRGLPASLFSAPAGSSSRDRAALGFLGATGLPIIVAVTAIGVDEEILTSGIAAALVGAGMLTVLLYPLIAITLRGDRTAVEAVARSGEIRAEEEV